ncbi:MAG: translation initiation factor [Flavobacteriales bacterium]|nr:translation initiation factor [Flavobacteriales bacterium]
MKNKSQIVYSTDPEYLKKLKEEDEELNVEVPGQFILKVRIEKKHRGGKAATIVSGYIGPESGLKALEKALKVKCGVGGSSKDGEIIIQGELADKVVSLLTEMGYKAKRAGG